MAKCKHDFRIPIEVKRIGADFRKFLNEGEAYPDYVLATSAHKLHQKGIKGEGIKIGILDTGHFPHSEFSKDKTIKVRDFTNSESGGVDVDSHGTHVQGTLRCGENNQFYVTFAPNAEYYIGKVLGDDGWGEWDWLQSALLWLIDEGVDFINLSLGGGGYHEGVAKALEKAYNAGIIIPAAAGNFGEEVVGFPASNFYCEAVGSVDRDGNVSYFSNRGQGLDLVAIGERVVSTINKPDTFDYYDGTSMATPQVTGVFAIHKQVFRIVNDREPTNDELRDLVYGGAKDLAELGYDIDTGFGMVNCEHALDLLTKWEESQEPEPPVNPPTPPIDDEIKEKLERVLKCLNEYVEIVIDFKLKNLK